MSNYPKRLIEVDLPIKRISAHARREKSIRHGHISTLHIWWARRPLAACRAVICAALWPDPADPLCPPSFRNAAAQQLTAFAKQVITNNDLAHTSTWDKWQAFAKQGNKLDPTKESHQNILRIALLDFIADFANWDNSTQAEYLDTSRALTQAAHEALGGEPGTRPLVVDPFAGGGAIPLEALRVGADAFASDLNPVAVLLNKVVLEYIPKYGQRLAEEVRKWGTWIKTEAEKDLAEFYPKDPDGATPIAYLWARTVVCEGPGCGVEVPVMRSLWLAKKVKGSVALRININSDTKAIAFELIQNAKAKDVAIGTSRRGSVTCPVCNYTTPVTSVRRQLASRSGGASDARIIAIRRDDPDTEQRSYRLTTENDVDAVNKAKEELRLRTENNQDSLSLVPDEPLPPQGTLGFRVQLYGIEKWGDLFSPRQALSISTIANNIRKAASFIAQEYDHDFSQAVQTCLAIALSRLTDFNSTLCTLNITGGRGVFHTFARQALPMVWDFMETNPFNNVGANWIAGIEAAEATIVAESKVITSAIVLRSSATEHPLPDDIAYAFITDPPYYDAVPYADLSDYFYVWLRRVLPEQAVKTLSGELTSKDDECIVNL